MADVRKEALRDEEVEAARDLRNEKLRQEESYTSA